MIDRRAFRNDIDSLQRQEYGSNAHLQASVWKNIALDNFEGMRVVSFVVHSKGRSNRQSPMTRRAFQVTTP
jgi:hypothetical protein